MKPFVKYSGILIVLILLNNAVYAQCTAAVREGINKLDPYSFNGQTNIVTVKSGKAAEMRLVFYKGYNYKVQISSETGFSEKVSFKIVDESGSEIFNSDANGKKADFFTFYSNSTQELKIILTSTENSKERHCVAILVGTQLPKNNSSLRYL
jgi:hypothetical protein